MTAQTQSTPDARIIVVLPLSLVRFATADPIANPFYSNLSEYADALWLACGAPAPLRLELEKAYAAEQGLQVAINGEPCPLPEGITNPEQARVLAHLVAWAVFEHRDLLIGAGLAEHLRNNWQFDLWPAQAFHQCLRERLRLRRPITKEALSGVTAEDPVGPEETTAIAVLLSPSAAADIPRIEELCAALQEEIFQSRGVVVPKVTARSEETLAENEFALEWNRFPCPPYRGLAPEEIVIDIRPEMRSILPAEAEVIAHPVDSHECWKMRDSRSVAATCVRMSVPVWKAPDYIVLHLKGAVLTNAAALVTLEYAELMLDLLIGSWPALVNCVRGRDDVIARVTPVLRNLAARPLAVRDMRTILENMLALRETLDTSGSEVIVLPPVQEPAVLKTARPIDKLTAEDYAAYLAKYLEGIPVL
jgi:hypothetical protein